MPPLGREERNKVTHNPYTPTGGTLHLERSTKGYGGIRLTGRGRGGLAAVKHLICH